MVELRLYAIGIDDVRDMFGAAPERAATLRSVAAEKFRVPQVEQRQAGMLSKIGPLFRRDPWAPKIPVDQPSPADVESLVTGKFVAPERLAPAWQVFQTWLDELSFGHVALTMTQPEWNDVGFDLARSGVPSQYSLERLLGQGLAIPLRPVASVEAGYAPQSHVLATRAELRQARDHVLPATAPALDEILSLLNNFDAYTRSADASGRPAPDAVAILRR